MPMLLHAESMGGGAFRLWFEAQPARSYVVEGSSNLATWSPWSTNAAVNGQVECIDADASSSGREKAP
jgi:hypothetical protein